MPSTINIQRLIPPTAENAYSNNVQVVARNPYASSSNKRVQSLITPSSSSTPPTTSANRIGPGRDSLVDVVFGRGAGSTTTAAGGVGHHHRWRQDRRFGCSVQMADIASNSNNSNNDDANGNNNDATNLDDIMASDDSDDDAMDELLSFRVFSNRTSSNQPS